MFRERSCIISGRSTLQVLLILFFSLLFFYLDYLVLPSQSVSQSDRHSSFFLSHSMAVFSANLFGLFEYYFTIYRLSEMIQISIC